MPDPELLNEWSTLITPSIMLIVLIITGIRGDWVFGWIYRELKESRDAWRSDSEAWRALAERVPGLVDEVADRRTHARKD